MSEERSRPLPWGPVIVSFAAFALYVSTMAPGLTWAHYGADGGDLATAVALGSVPHPTGYPTYLLIASLFARLPLRDLHASLNLMSAVTAALATGMIAWVGSRILPGRISPWAGLLAGGVLATSTLFWSQALITEVYALHALAIALLAAWTIAGMDRERGAAWAFAGGLLLGAGLGNHLLVGLILPGILWAMGRPRVRRHVLLWGAGLLVGLLPYASLPIRAHAGMPPNWGGADSWEGFWWLVTGRLYRRYMQIPNFTVLSVRVRQLAALALDQYGWWGLPLAVWGLFVGEGPMLSQYRRLTVWTILAYSGWALMYQVTDWPVYTLPVWILLSVWVAVGVAALAELSRRPWLISLGLLCPIVAGAIHAPQVGLRTDTEAIRTVEQVWAVIPQHALVLVDGDRATFGLGYTHFVLHQRPDVRLVNRTLWAFPWYRRSLNRYYGNLLPSGQDVHLGALVEADAHRPVYLVGDTVPAGVRFAPDGPYYRLQPIPGTGSLAVGRLLRGSARSP